MTTERPISADEHLRGRSQRIGSSAVALLVLMALGAAPAGAEFWAHNTGPEGGTVVSLAVDPANSAVVYAGANGARVFKTTNGGALWTSASLGLSGGSVDALVIDSTNTSTVYAVLSNTGVFKTTNGGVSWISAGAGLPTGSTSALAIDPANSQAVYAGTAHQGVFKTTDGGVSWAVTGSGPTSITALALDSTSSGTVYAATAGSGVFKTSDGGVSWIAINVGLAGLYVDAVVIDPVTPGTVYASSGDDGVSKTTDGGSTWAESGVGLFLLSGVNLGGCLAIDASNPTTLYLGSYYGVYRTTNGGASWTLINTDLWVLALAIDPATPSSVYAGTIDWGVSKTTDSGGSWVPVNTGLSGKRVHALAIDPASSSTVYAATPAVWVGNSAYVGVSKTTDSGGTWTAADSGLPDNFVVGLAIDPTIPTTVYAASYSGISKTTNGGDSWMMLDAGGSAFQVAIDPENPSTLYATIAESTVGVRKSTDAGLTWAAASSGLSHSGWYNSSRYVYTYAPLVIDPLSPDTLYVGIKDNGIFKTTNGGVSWGVATPDLATTYSLAINPDRPSTLYAGADGGVYSTTNAGVTWNRISYEFNGFTSNYEVYGVVVDPTNPSTVYAATAFRGIFNTTNEGETWVAFNSGLPNLNALSLAIAPLSPHILYAGIVGGVFAQLCGNVQVDGGEQCDDGNLVSGDGCSSACILEIGYQCSVPGVPCATLCGDSVRAGSEGCDDGNTSGADGCSSTCLLETGYECPGAGSPCTPICDDGLILGFEQCDTGGVASHGCLGCFMEDGYACSGEPSVCTPICGDALITLDEQCEDGNTMSGDCCSSMCQFEPATAGCITSLSIAKNAGNSSQLSSSTTRRTSTTGISSATGRAFVSRYAAGLAVDAAASNSASTTLNSDYSLQFAVNVPAGSPYRVHIDSSLHGDVNLISDSGGTATGTVGPVSGSQGGGSLSGSLDLLGTSSASGATANTVVNRGATAVVAGVGSGAPADHSLTFTWSQTCTSNSEECGIRLGQSASISGTTAGRYPGTPTRTAADDGHFVSATLTWCGDHTVDPEESCDEGASNGDPSSCCNADCTLASAATTCRASAGACDLAEFCSGNSVGCPADAKSTSVCRAEAGDCDAAETCNGVNNTCPGDAAQANGTACTADSNPCTLDQCSSGACTHPAGNAGAVCRPAAGTCDIVEQCTGASSTCPADAVVAAGIVCRPASGECDLSESCSGSSAQCPTNLFKADGTVCSDDGNACTPDECSTGICAHLDADSDSIGDLCDNCANKANPDQINSDCPDPTFFPAGCSAPTTAKAGCCDGGDVCDACPAQKDNSNCDPQGSAGANIGPAGGTIATADGSVSMTIPPGALSTNTSITVTENGPATRFLLTNGAVFSTSMRPENLQFQLPVTITFAWKDRDGDGKVDRGICVGGGDAGQSCNRNGGCLSNVCSVNTNTAELSLVLKRNAVHFSKEGFNAGPYACADHMDAGCTTVANCNDAPGTGKATVANCCNPTTNTWTFQTCSFSEYFIGLSAGDLIPGKGKVTSECVAEWAVRNPQNVPFTATNGLPNLTQTCHDGDPTCDLDASVDGDCEVEVAVCFNVTDPRLRDGDGNAACTPEAVSSWTVKKPHPDSSKVVDAANAIALRDAVAALGDSLILDKHHDRVAFAPSLSTGDACTAPVILKVVRRSASAKGKVGLKMQTISYPGIDSDSLKLICVPPA